ncbi:MAG: hypothetical protein L0227_06860 [Chloroflexi bacterium]|nr:hypothetical protein [Chloroflexota bacterium]
MTAPILARQDDAGDRLYPWGSPPEGFYSVTTIIAGGVPKYLVPWAAKSVADLVFAELASRAPNSRGRSALRHWARVALADVAARQAEGGLTSLNLEKMTERELATRYLKGEPERIRDKAATLGIDVHDAAEQRVLDLIARTGQAYADREPAPEWPPELEGHMASFGAFLNDFQPEYLATEATVFNRAQAYAGTLDAIMRLQIGGRWLQVLVDYKSGRDVYPEVALQLAAYSRAEFIGGADGVTEHPVPVIDAGLVLHVTPTRYRPRLVRIDEPMFRAFLHAREVFRWRKALAKTAFLQDLTPPVPELAEASA